MKEGVRPPPSLPFSVSTLTHTRLLDKGRNALFVNAHEHFTAVGQKFLQMARENEKREREREETRRREEEEKRGEKRGEEGEQSQRTIRA